MNSTYPTHHLLHSPVLSRRSPQLTDRSNPPKPPLFVTAVGAIAALLFRRPVWTLYGAVIAASSGAFALSFRSRAAGATTQAGRVFRNRYQVWLCKRYALLLASGLLEISPTQLLRPRGLEEPLSITQ